MTYRGDDAVRVRIPFGSDPSEPLGDVQEYIEPELADRLDEEGRTLPISADGKYVMTCPDHHWRTFWILRQNRHLEGYSEAVA